MSHLPAKAALVGCSLSSMLLIYIIEDFQFLYVPAFINVVASGILAFLYRRSAFIFPVLFLYCYVVYSIFIGRYLVPEIAPRINGIIDYEYDGVGLIIVSATTAFIALLLRPPNNFYRSPLRSDNLTGERNILLSLFCLITGVLIELFFIDRQNTVFGGRASYSPIYEYGVIFYIFSFYFARGYHRIFSYGIGCIAIFFAFRDFSMGHRATGIQLFFVCYFFILSRYYSYKRFLAVCSIGVPLMTAVAVFRGSWSISEMSLESLLTLLTTKYLAFDTAYFAYVASLSFVAVRELADMTTLFGQFLDFLGSQIVIGTVGQSLYEISKESYQHANGGILPFYLYYYLGLASIPITAWLIASYFNLIAVATTKTISAQTMMIFSYIFATSPRWLIYSPNQLLRGVLIFFIVFFFLRVTHKLLTVKPR